MPEEGQEGGYAVHGTVAKGYESVRSLFEANFKSGREANAQLCAYVGDQKVVDLWGTAINDKEYSADSLTTVFSSTKSLTAIVFASLVDQGLLDYEDKISSVWPEFAENGKGELTVSSVMRHEAGLARIKGKFSSQGLYKDGIRKNILGEYLEHQKLQYPPEGSGTTRQYHSLSRGFILQEIFRRVDPKKRTIGEYLKEEIARPLETDTYLGASESEIARRSPLAGWSKAKVVWNHIVPEVFGSKIEKTALGYSGALYYSYIVSQSPGPTNIYIF